LGVSEGDPVRVVSARGEIAAAARISDIRPGTVFVPFHYGSWDLEDEQGRAANNLTVTAWDPVSKQPIFKVAAVSLERIGDGDGKPAPAPTNTASAPVEASVPATVGGTAAESLSEVVEP
jgi:predicted molibdopterin-dependent oxidoreductase YjgC